MNRRDFLAVPVGLGAAGLAGAADDRQPPLPKRGVSLAGAEFGTHKAGFSNENPGEFGKDYTYNSEKTVGYFCDKQLGLLRIPFRWERIQPKLGKDLNGDEVKRLQEVVGWARKHKGQVILDVHNYGRYILAREGKPRTCIIDQAVGGDVLVSRRHFGDLWRRLARVFKDEEAVAAHGLMNEPHDMGKSDWKKISQEAVDAIRGEGDRKLILVAGDDWSNAQRFVRANGPTAWIKDANIAYEAHCYFDRDHHGQYKAGYDTELNEDAHLELRGVERLVPFVGWCRINNVRGFLGEYGIPKGEPRWRKLLAPFLKALDQAGMNSCYWAAGEWWNNYDLSLQPAKDFKEASPLLASIQR